MRLSWDADDERVEIEVFPFDEAAVVSPEQVDEDFEPDPEEIFLVRIPAGTARAFVKRAAQVLDAGRPAARSAAARSTRTVTSACGPTGSGAAIRDGDGAPDR